ncbi:unnamed protein product [Blepharisma stoltei]|uniref:Ribosomal protein S14 n=1 Tax=Blepharisma stoltei TaxID=1481888 RepID=A0AAU9K995_9CILI|nr:unnamed protein product [Blepharisma stoltei]
MYQTLFFITQVPSPFSSIATWARRACRLMRFNMSIAYHRLAKDIGLRLRRFLYLSYKILKPLNIKIYRIW